MRSRSLKNSEVRAFSAELAPCPRPGRRYGARMERSDTRGVPGACPEERTLHPVPVAVLLADDARVPRRRRLPPSQNPKA